MKDVLNGECALRVNKVIFEFHGTYIQIKRIIIKANSRHEKWQYARITFQLWQESNSI